MRVPEHLILVALLLAPATISVHAVTAEIASNGTTVSVHFGAEEYRTSRRLDKRSVLRREHFGEGGTSHEPCQPSLVSGLRAMAATIVNLLIFMPLHTIINYQYAFGTGIGDSVRSLASEGVLRFYAGFFWVAPIALVKRFVETFSVEENKAWILEAVHSSRSAMWAMTISALFAALAASILQIVIMPFDTMKTCSQVKGSCQSIKDRMSSRGLLACWDGTQAAAVAAFLASIGFWGATNLLDYTLPVLSYRFLRSSVIGFAAGATSDVCVNAFRVIKVQLQSGLQDPQGQRSHPVRGLQLKLLLRAVEGLAFMVLWKGPHAESASPQSPHALTFKAERPSSTIWNQCAWEDDLDGMAQDAKPFASAAAIFLELSQTYASGNIPGEAAGKAKRFIRSHLLNDFEGIVAEILARDVGIPEGLSNSSGKERFAMDAIAKPVSTLFAARHASLALKSLSTAAAMQRREILLHGKRKLEMALQSAFPNRFWFQAADDSSRGFMQAWASVTGSEQDLRRLLVSSGKLLRAASSCVLKFDFPRMATAFDLPQKRNIRFATSGTITKDSKLYLGNDLQGKPIHMPMFGLGTGFGDCANGRAIAEIFTQEGEVARYNGLQCNTDAPAGWASKLSMVDTAALYGTESMVGHALHDANRSRKEQFVMTKLPTKATWPLLNISRGIDNLQNQLKDLQMEFVDVLLLHHDDFNDSEWRSMEDTLTAGKTRALGVSSMDTAQEVHDCAEQKRCKAIPAVAEEPWSPCMMTGAMRYSPPKGTSMVATTAVESCIGEPIVASIAQQKGVNVAALSIRWVVQTGVPVLIQTRRQDHLQQDLSAMDWQLTEKEMGLLSSMSTLYQLRGNLDEQILQAIGEHKA